MLENSERQNANSEKQFRILFIGDIVAGIGRRAVKALLPSLKEELKIDFVIANGENMTTGHGFTYDAMHELLGAGVDFFTSGNHVWKKREFFGELSKPETPVIRPANYPSSSPGTGYKIVTAPFGRILIANLLGRERINANVESPFKVIDEILDRAKGLYDFSLVDFHAEITSEKVAMGYYLDGRVDIVVGTHTHVPTADPQILPNGTAFISDVGMVGPKKSILGVETDIIIKLFLTGMPQKFEVAKGPCIFNSVIMTFDAQKRMASIERVDREVSPQS